jgi:hypothetical protein
VQHHRIGRPFRPLVLSSLLFAVISVHYR